MSCRRNPQPPKGGEIAMNPTQIVALALLAAASVLQEIIRNEK